MKVILKVYRFDSARDKAPRYDAFDVEAESTSRILDCLNKIRWEQDGSLSYRMSCGQGVCGSDGMTINGTSALACQKLVKDYPEGKEITVEPLRFFPVVKDLIVDMGPFFERENSVHPEGGINLKSVEGTGEHLQTPAERELFDEDIRCIMCACCTAACPVNLGEEPEYVGPAAVVKAHRYIFDSRMADTDERMRIMERPHGVWACRHHWMCTVVCPKKIPVTKHIYELKKRNAEAFGSHGGEIAEVDKLLGGFPEYRQKKEGAG